MGIKRIRSLDTSKEDHVSVTSFNQNPNVGQYAFANDKFCLLGSEIDERYDKILENTLKVPVHRINIAGTSLIGVFLAGNDDCILVPSITFDYELKKLEELGINYKIIDSNITALGNTIVCNKNGVYVSDEFSARTKKVIRTALNLPLKPGKISELSSVGSCIAINDSGAIIHREAEEFEIRLLTDFLQVPVEEGTVNLGSPYVKSGIILNNKGFVIGGLSTGPEITNADQALGFLDKEHVEEIKE